MGMLKSNKLKLIPGILISAVFLYLAIRRISFRHMVLAREEVNYWYLAPAAVFLFLSLWFRAYRWGIFFRPLKPMRMRNLFSSLLIGYMANNVLPFRLGEFLRAYSIGKAENFSKIASFATIVLERIIDVITLLIFMGVILLFQPFPRYVKSSGLIIFIICASALLFMVLLVIRTEGTLLFYRKFTRFIPQQISQRGERILRSLIDGLAVLRRPRYCFMIALHSALIWLSYVMIVHMLVYAFNFQIDYGLTLLASVTVLVMTAISVSVPSSPGYIGTYHYLVMLGLEIYKVPSSTAFSFAVVLHLFTMLPVTLIGLYYFMRRNLTIHAAYEEKKIIEQAADKE